MNLSSSFQAMESLSDINPAGPNFFLLCVG
uniref:Uncharacterized protein n=1 Tax=Lepeophtheirus salmonis TaxID=72036 RepID=A0A0K2THA8_LEPSM